MIRVAALILLLCGTGLALSSSAPSQHEEYIYRGHVIVGVNNPRQAYSGSLVDLKLTIDRHADNSADVTFSNSEAEDFNRQVYIGDDPPIPRGSGVSKKVTELDGTVKVYFNRESGTVMEVDADEALWVTNIRKAIVSMLRVPPYVGDSGFVDLERNTFHPRGQQITRNEQLSYFKTEETFAGRCNVSYTMNPDYNNGHWAESPDNVLPAGGNYFRMHRSIDFDSCHDPVGLHKASFGNFSRAYASQFEQVMTRSTSAEYLLRERSDGFFDIKGVQQIGAIYVRPYGQDAGRMVSYTNQTLSLKVCKESHNGSSALPPVSNIKPVTTWKYQFESPAKPKQSTKVDWVIYRSVADQLAPVYPELAILGQSAVPSQQTILSQTNEILDEITQLQQQENQDYNMPYNGTNDGRVAELLNVVARAIRALDYKSVKSIFDATKPAANDTPAHRIHRQSFIDAAIASGSAPAIKCFVEAVKANQIDNIRAAALFASMINNIYDPASLPDVLNLVMSITPARSVYLCTSAHLNFAKLVQRVCANPSIKSYAVPQSYLGEKECDRNAVAKKFSDHLRSKIQSVKTVWETMMYTQALASLGMDENIPILRDIAMGKFASAGVAHSLPCRLGAIHALARNYPEKPQKQQVMLQLLPIAENHAENFQVREAAFITMVSMKPNSTFFQRFAADSWHDPSYRMRSLVATTMISLAQSNDESYHRMSSLARLLLPTMRPVQPSMQNSLYFNFKTEVPEFHIGVQASVAWLQKYMSSLAAPQQMMHDLRGDFGGIEVPILEIYTMYDSNSIRAVSAKRGNSHDVNQRNIHREMAELVNNLGQEMQMSGGEIYLYTSAFHHQGFFNFSTESSSSLIRNVVDFVSKNSGFGQGEQPFFPLQTVKYTNPLDIISILPSPFGLPTIVELSAPTNMLNNHMYHAHHDAHSINVTITGQYKTTLKTQSFISILQPWSNMTAIAGFDTETTMSFPGQFSVVASNTYPFAIVRTTISPQFQGQKPVFHWRSKPLSAIKEIGPVSDITIATNLITCLANGTQIYKKHFEFPEQYLGLKNLITYDGDVDYPFQQANVIKVIQNPALLITALTSPTQYDFAFTLKLDMQKSETKNISIASVIDYGYMSGDNRRSEKTGTPESVGQEIAEEISLRFSPEELATRTAGRQLGDYLFSFAMNYTAPNVRNRQYAFVIAGSNLTTSSSKQLEETVVISLMRKGVPGREGERKTCLVTSIREQKAPSGDNQHHSQIYTTAHTDLYAGKACSKSEKVADLQAYLYLRTDERAATPCEGMNLLCSSAAEAGNNPTSRTAYISDAIYDKIDFELTLGTGLPEYYQNMTWYAGDMATGAVFPSVVFNRMPGAGSNVPTNKVYVNVTRSVAGGVIDAWVHRRDCIGVVRNLEIRPIFDWATPLLGNRIKYYHEKTQSTSSSSRVTFEASPDNRCLVKPQSVETFDSISYEKVESGCFAVVTQVYHEDDVFSIMSREVRGEKEVKFLAPSIAKIEILPGKIIKINNQLISSLSVELKDQSGKVVGSISKTSEDVILVIQNKLKLVVKNDELMIELAEQYRSFMNGLCGVFGGDKATDLKSPKGCLMIPEQGKIYCASWVTYKEQCHEPEMAKYIKEAEELEASECRRSLSYNIPGMARDSSRMC